MRLVTHNCTIDANYTTVFTPERALVTRAGMIHTSALGEAVNFTFQRLMLVDCPRVTVCLQQKLAQKDCLAKISSEGLSS